MPIHQSWKAARHAQWQIRERLRCAVKAQQTNAKASDVVGRTLQALCFIGRSRYALHYREHQYES